MTSPNPPHARVQRLPDRGRYDAETVHAILDEALVCHVGFVQDGQPYVIPTLHVRRGEEVLLHGAATSRLMRHVQAGHPVCLTVSLVDGLVLAKTVFNHSVNYRSAVVFGHGRGVDEPEAKLEALHVFTEKILPGRWAEVRPPNETEMKATAVVAVTIEAASAKLRTGQPHDDPEDEARPVWAGVIPLRTLAGEPQPAPYSDPGLDIPGYLQAWLETAGRK